MTDRRFLPFKKHVRSALGVAAMLAMLAPFQPAVTAAQAATPDQGQAVSSINGYLNSFQTLIGEFIQFGPDGSRIEGTFALKRPGKIHFKYAEPAQVDVVSDGKSVAVRDKRRKTQDLWPLKRTPLKFLLSEDIDLMASSNVTDVSVEGDITTVVIKESTLFGEGTLTMIFDGTTHELKQWTITDGKGQDTSVAIYNVEKDQPVDDGRFKIKYLKNRQLQNERR